MRKLKPVKNIETKPIITLTHDEIIFFGITAVCKKSILDYVFLLDNSVDFIIDDKIKEMLVKTEEIICLITATCPKKFWNDLEILQVKSKTADYFPYLEALTKIKTAADIEKAKIYVQDYELITSLVTSREFFKEVIAAGTKPEAILHLGKINYRLNHIIKYFLNEIFFGKPPKVDKKTPAESKIIELDILIDNEGRLINRKGYYEKFMIKDENENMYCAGLAADGRLVALNQDDGNSILNLTGEKLKWKNTLKIKADSMAGLYKFGDAEIVTNMRRFQYQDLIKECQESKIDNIEIVKTLIEMSGYAVGRD